MCLAQDVVRVEVMSDDTPRQPIPDELKVDVDQDALAEWDAVKGEYAPEGEQEEHRPVFTDPRAAQTDATGPEEDLLSSDASPGTGDLANGFDEDPSDDASTADGSDPRS